VSAGVLIEGYVVCDRGHEPRPVRAEVARVTGGICDECFSAEFRRKAATIELVMNGRRFRVPERRGPRGKHRRKVLTEGRIERKKLAAKARENARKRLSTIFGDLYDVLLAEERGKLGLNPWPVEIAVRAKSPEPDLELAQIIMAREVKR
jgi:hypothetical protein